MRSIYGHDRAKKIRKKQTQSADVLLLDFLLHEGILGLTIETRPSPSESLTPKNILLDILSTHVTHISDPVLNSLSLCSSSLSSHMELCKLTVDLILTF